jgi:repressor LexA
MIENMTEKQRQILQFLKEHIAENGFPPTLREIGDRFGIRSTNGVNDHLQALERKGMIRKSPDKSRAIEILHEDEAMEESFNPLPAPGMIPILGAIAAGPLSLLATENIEGYLKVDQTVINAEEAFAVQVRGDSMIEDHIINGDYVIIRKQSYGGPRDIVAVIVENEVTLKRFYNHGDYIELKPSNAAMSPIIVRRGEAPVHILGKMIGLIRKT